MFALVVACLLYIISSCILVHPSIGNFFTCLFSRDKNDHGCLTYIYIQSSSNNRVRFCMLLFSASARVSISLFSFILASMC